MPRKWKRKTTRGSWGEETMKMALKFVEEGNSIRASCRKYGIPVRTLQERRRNNNTSKPIFGRKTTFTPEQEQALTDRIKTLSNASNGLTATAIQRAAFNFAEKNGILHKFSAIKRLAGKDWLYGFLQRNQSIRIRKHKATSTNRITGFNTEEIAIANNGSSTTRNAEDERIPVVIKEEIDVPQDYDLVSLSTTGTSRDEDCVDCETRCSESEISPEVIKEDVDGANSKSSFYSPRLGMSKDEHQRGFQNTLNDDQTDLLNHCSDKSKCINSKGDVAIPKIQSKVSSVENLGIPGILKIAEEVSLDIQNILTHDISNFGKINPVNLINSRNSTPHPSANTKINSTFLKTEYSELEAKLRIYYLNSMMKKKEELIDSKLKLCKLQIAREQTELNNIKKSQLLRVKNLKLKYAILKSKFEKRCKYTVL